MLNAVVALRTERGWRGPIIALHADLGSIEWTGDPDTPGFRSSPEHVKKIAADTGVRLVVCHRSDGRGMVEHWKARADKVGNTKRFWSSAAMRYCTSDLKRGPMDVAVRRWCVARRPSGSS
jgi:hypothetical protein